MGCAGNNRAKRRKGMGRKYWICRKKMEQETRYHHMFGYIQTATPRETMMVAGGEVVSKEKMRRETGGGPGRDEIS